MMYMCVQINTYANILFIMQNKRIIKIKWQRCTDSPVTNAIPQTVKIDDNVYVGHGLRKRNEDQTVFKYSLTQDTWSRLPPCPTNHYGFASLDEELILVGGNFRGSRHQPTNAVYIFRDNTWRQDLLPMPTPRNHLSTASYANKLIIAAGGVIRTGSNEEKIFTDKVELYKKDTSSWYTTKRLPFKLTQFNIQMVGDKCYTLGGTTDTFNQSSTAVFATVSSLIENAIPVDSTNHTPQISATWEKLKDEHPLTHPSLVELGGRLVVMGGSIDHQRRLGTRYISTYDFATDTWVECKGAELPLAVYRPGLVNLGNNQVMLIGGQPKSQRFSTVTFIGSYY